MEVSVNKPKGYPLLTATLIDSLLSVFPSDQLN